MADIPVSQTYINCGFFDAVEVEPGVFDREYSAEQMSKPYERLITDGIFATDIAGSPSSDLKVIADEGLTVKIQKGAGMFNTKWFELLDDQIISIPENDNEDGYDRIDTVLVQISSVAREGTVIYRTGTPAEEPVAPDVTDFGDLHEYRIANVYVSYEADEMTDANISDRRGIDTPFVASLIQTLSTQQLFTQWNDLFNTYFLQKKAEVDAFIASLTEDLNVSMDIDEVVTNTTISTETTEVSLGTYDSQSDIIFIIVNGYLTRETLDYTINSQGTLATFENTLEPGTKVTTRVLKSVKAPLQAEGREF